MKLWGSRFKKEMAQEAFDYSASIHFDCKLWKHDIQGSIAHARMLGKCGIIPQSDVDDIIDGLEQIRSEIAATLKRGEDPFDYSSEDIHTEIERRLTEKIGAAGGRLHTARSRNDQVALDMRLYVREACEKIQQALARAQKALLSQAEQHLTSQNENPERSTLPRSHTPTILPGYTHRQHAQPVLLSHHLLAYFWKFQRDKERFADCRKRANVSPLGAAALAGTSFPTDPAMVAQELGFDGVFENSMDAVSDRDFVAEFLSAAALCVTHLSSLAGELVLWSSPEFGFLALGDEWCTGSSIMPQKRNPDMAELVHGKSGRVVGHLMAFLTLLKGLPLTYNKDLQEDKEALFDADETLQGSLSITAGMLETAVFRTDTMLSDVEQSPFVAATEIADYLTKKGLPFRQSHSVAAKIVQYCEETGKGLTEVALEDLHQFSNLFEQDVLDILNAPAVAAAKTSPGGTAPERVAEQLETAKRNL